MATEEDENEEKILLGVNLIGEPLSTSIQTCLGIVVLSKSLLPVLNMDGLRNLLSEQIVTLPHNYLFCMKQNWSIALGQEKLVKVGQVITEEDCILIKRSFDKPRIGVKSPKNIALGFIFVDYNLSLKNTRDVIDLELSNIPKTYSFSDCNGWPISNEQENQLTVLDILTNSCLIINFETHNLPSGHSFSSSLNSTLSKAPWKRLKVSLPTSSRLSVSSGQPSADSTGDKTLRKQILISYVRAEAAHHALCLKQKLSKLGFSIYLDVDEIHSGVDWQDSLNYAVSNCEMFVPLVTPRYGETQWTNREVKLADVLGKLILPISFIEDWPPACLAIQFATTQYIRWKTKAIIQTELAEGKGESATDIRFWSESCIEKVSRDIADRILGSRGDYPLTLVPTLSKRKTVVRSCACVNVSNPQAMLSDREGNPLVLLCIHPDQQAIGLEMQSWLRTENFDVWCSTELDIDYSDSLPCSAEAVSLSQVSMFEMSSTQEMDNRLIFQEQADDASVVIMLLSEAFSKSKTCQQQIFYCEHRKRVIPVKTEDFPMPGWMSMLIGSSCIENIHSENYKESLISRLRRSLDPCARKSPGEAINEARITYAVKKLLKQLPAEGCVYVTGATKFKNEKTETICRYIGKELASLHTATLVTGGFFGVGETVGRSFLEKTEELGESHQIWHILPEKDPEDQSYQANQNKDGTFEINSYGNTVFYGSSVRERESIVARVFDICILVEGEADEFSWNDHVVIPVRCTGAAADGQFEIPDKVFEIPQGVSADDWLVLQDNDASPSAIAQAVKQIVSSLHLENASVEKTKNKKSALKKQKSSSSKSPKSPRGQTKFNLNSMSTVILDNSYGEQS